MSVKIYLNSDNGLVIEESNGVVYNRTQGDLSAKSENGRIQFSYSASGASFKDYAILDVTTELGVAYGSYSAIISAISDFFVDAALAAAEQLAIRVDYLEQKQYPVLGGRMVAIGDSQTACDTPFSIDPSRNQHASSWTTFLANSSGGKITLIKNVAVGGQQTDQMLARFNTDVLAFDPDFVIIAASINDGNLPNKEIDGIANHIAMHNLCKNHRTSRCPNGVPVIFVTNPPTGTYELNDGTVASRTLISNYNLWKRYYCEKNGIPLIDFNLFYTDAQGSYKQGATLDGVHPSDPWHKLSGAFAWDSIKSYFPQPAILLPKSNTDPNNKMTNGMLFPAKSGVPSGWGGYGESSVVQTVEIVSGHRGMCLKIVNSGTANRYNESPIVQITGIDGHKVRLSSTINGGSASWKWVGGVLNNVVAFSISPLQGITEPFEQISEVIVPNGATGLQLTFTVKAGNTGYISAIGIYDLTAKGLE